MQRKTKNRIRDIQDTIIQELDTIKRTIAVIEYQLLMIEKLKLNGEED